MISIQSVVAAPPGNPLGGSPTANFSGLNVTGNTAVGGNLSVTGTINGATFPAASTGVPDPLILNNIQGTQKVYTGAPSGHSFSSTLPPITQVPPLNTIPSYGDGDLVSTGDLYVDQNIYSLGTLNIPTIRANDITSAGALVGLGLVSSEGDITALGDIWTEGDIFTNGGALRTGNPATGPYASHPSVSDSTVPGNPGAGDLYSADDLFVQDDGFVNGNLTVTGQLIANLPALPNPLKSGNPTVFPATTNDVAAQANLLADGQLKVGGASTLRGATTVGTTTTNANLTVNGAATVNGTATLGNATVGNTTTTNTLSVTGNASVGNGLTAFLGNFTSPAIGVIASKDIESTGGKIYTGPALDWTFPFPGITAAFSTLVGSGVTPILAPLDIIAKGSLLAGGNLYADALSFFGGVAKFYSFVDMYGILRLHNNVVQDAAYNTTVGNDLTVGDDVQVTGYVQTGTPSARTSADGDINATNNVWADLDIAAGDDLLAEGDVNVDGNVVAGLGSGLFGFDVGASTGKIVTGAPTIGIGDGDIGATDDIYADDNIHSGNNITAGGNIGAFYYRSVSTAFTTTGLTTADAACDSGDVMVSCSGYVSSLGGNNIFLGSYPLSATSCRVRGKRGVGTSSDSVVVHAYCFSANG